MSERIEIFELIERLDAASRDETLSDGMLYRAAAERLAEYISRDVKYWHSIMRRTDKQADRIAELKAQQEEYEYNASCIMATKDKRIAELEEQLHYTKGCCDLAMKHRDEAEAKLARVEKLSPYLFANDSAYQQFRKILEQDS